MKKNVLLIVNPVSGALEKLQIIESTRAFALKKNLNLVLYTTTGKEDIVKIRKLYSQYESDRIIIAGGDGTIKMVAEAFEEHDVILGILPAGSANGLSADLNLKDTLDENLEIAFENHFIEMDTLLINGRRSFHLSDLGVNAELIKNYKKSDVHGKMGYLLQVFNTLNNLKEPFQSTINVNGEVIHSIARMIVIANSTKYGTGVVINPEGKMDDGKFEIILLKNLDLDVIFKIISGNMPLISDDVLIYSTDKATIATNFPVCFQIDGEYIGLESTLDITISSHKIKVAIP